MTVRVPIGRQVGVLVQEQPHVERRLRGAVARGQMRPAEADYLIESLAAAIATLEWVRDNEATIKRVHAAMVAGEEAEG